MVVDKVFQNKIDEINQKLMESKKTQRLIIVLRITTFSLFAFFLYNFFSLNFDILYLAFSIISILFFSIVSRFDLKHEENTKIFEILRNINLAEINALKNNIYASPSGDNYINSSHSFNYDLDVFGKNSLYQVINRTTLLEGSDKLAYWLSNPLYSSKVIKDRQVAIIELTSLLDWRQKFQALGKLQNLENKAFPFFIVNQKYHSFNNFLKVFIYAAPIISFLLIILSYFHFVSYIVPLSTIISQLLLCVFFNYRINKAENKLIGLARQLYCYLNISKHIKAQEFNSIYINKLKSKLFSSNSNIESAFNELASILKAYDQRNNVFWFILSNSFVLRDLHVLHRFEKWQEKFNFQVVNWIDSISEIDALNSLANFYFLNPDFCIPEISEQEILNSRNLGHPLINSKQRITNDFKLLALQKFYIVTGANMAGKSTFLRTIGINMLLASIGAPVCAKSFLFTPITLFTSMRTTDNLSENTSYFHAELLRLQQLMDTIKKSNKSLIILDEIMKGTNSKDKYLGSKLFLEKILNFNVSGIIATHDIDLGILEKEYPNNFENICFEIEIKDDKIIFDYKINKGITQNLNVTFLLKKMKLI